MKEKRVKGKRVLTVVAPSGFRDEELQRPKPILESEGAEVKVASGGKQATVYPTPAERLGN